MSDPTLDVLRYFKQLCLPEVEHEIDPAKFTRYKCLNDKGLTAFSVVLPSGLLASVIWYYRELQDDKDYQPSKLAITNFLLDRLDDFELSQLAWSSTAPTFFFERRTESPQHLSTGAAQSSLVASA